MQTTSNPQLGLLDTGGLIIVAAAAGYGVGTMLYLGAQSLQIQEALLTFEANMMVDYISDPNTVNFEATASSIDILGSN